MDRDAHRLLLALKAHHLAEPESLDDLGSVDDNEFIFSVMEEIDAKMMKWRERLDTGAPYRPSLGVKHRVVEIEQTCFACPAQWSGRTDTGETVYVRFRFGHLTVDINDEQVYGGSHGGGFSGDMSYGEMVEHTSGVISWPGVCKGEG